MSHTKEPWVAERTGKAFHRILAADGRPVAANVGGGHENPLTPEELEDNARRIVACVNACAGISTENLETNLPVNELARRYNVVLGQRELLLMALRQFKQADNEAQLIEAMDRANEIMVGITTVEGGAQ